LPVVQPYPLFNKRWEASSSPVLPFPVACRARTSMLPCLCQFNGRTGKSLVVRFEDDDVYNPSMFIHSKAQQGPGKTRSIFRNPRDNHWRHFADTYPFSDSPGFDLSGRHYSLKILFVVFWYNFCDFLTAFQLFLQTYSHKYFMCLLI